MLAATKILLRALSARQPLQIRSINGQHLCSRRDAFAQRLRGGHDPSVFPLAEKLGIDCEADDRTNLPLTQIQNDEMEGSEQLSIQQLHIYKAELIKTRKEWQAKYESRKSPDDFEYLRSIQTEITLVQEEMVVLRKIQLRSISNSTDCVDKDVTQLIAAFRLSYCHRNSIVNPDVITFRYNGTSEIFIKPVEADTVEDDSDMDLDDTQTELNEKAAVQNTWTSLSQTLVVGTAGIGKSAARLLYIILWLEGEMMTQFDHVYFNLNEQCFRADKDGSIFSVPCLTGLELTQSLLLLDPCSFLHNAQTVACKMLVAFSSPSYLCGPPNKPNLGELSQNSAIYVMKPPMEDHILKMFPGVDTDEDRFETFSWEENGIRYCAARWFAYSEEEVALRLQDSLLHVSKKALWSWLQSNKEEHVRDSELPHDLCKVENTRKGWMITGFFSYNIERMLFLWANGGRETEKDKLAALLPPRQSKPSAKAAHW